MKKTTKELIEGVISDRPKYKPFSIKEAGLPDGVAGEPEQGDAKDAIKKLLANVDAGKAKALLSDIIADL